MVEQSVQIVYRQNRQMVESNDNIARLHARLRCRTARLERYD
jgi:hypothetical protein